MTVSIFFILLGITILMAIIIRTFWIEIFIVGYVIYVLGLLTFYSLVTALLWAGFVTVKTEGFLLLWLYIFLLFSIILIFYALIVFDIVNMAIDIIRKIFKI